MIYPLCKTWILTIKIWTWFKIPDCGDSVKQEWLQLLSIVEDLNH